MHADEQSEFAAAARWVRESQAHVDTDTQLRLYALFKVATAGLCHAPQPSLFSLDFAARPKWQAWKTLSDALAADPGSDSRARAEARDQYVALVRTLSPDNSFGSRDNGDTRDDNDDFDDTDYDDNSDSSSSTSNNKNNNNNNSSSSNHPFAPSLSVLMREPDLDTNPIATNIKDYDTLFDAVKSASLANVQAFLQRIKTNCDNLPNAIDNEINRPRSEDLATPLHWACDRNLVDIAELLISCHANLNPRDSIGMTPLHYAKLNGNTQVYEILLKAGADASIRDDSGFLAQDL